MKKIENLKELKAGDNIVMLYGDGTAFELCEVEENALIQQVICYVKANTTNVQGEDEYVLRQIPGGSIREDAYLLSPDEVKEWKEKAKKWDEEWEKEEEKSKSR
jgi:hypothetical protein